MMRMTFMKNKITGSVQPAHCRPGYLVSGMSSGSTRTKNMDGKTTTLPGCSPAQSAHCNNSEPPKTTACTPPTVHDVCTKKRL